MYREENIVRVCISLRFHRECRSINIEKKRTLAPDSKAAPDGASNTAGRLHKRPQQRRIRCRSNCAKHLARLRLLLSAISDAVTALRDQNADADADIAYELTEQVSEPLNYEIEYFESLLASRPRRRRQQEAHA